MPTQETVRPILHSKLDKVAIFLLSLPEKEIDLIFSKLGAEEVKAISQRMAILDSIEKADIEDLYLEFIESIKTLIDKSEILGDTEKSSRDFASFIEYKNILKQEELKENSLSETLKNITPLTLAHFLKNEQPQTIALILSRINPEKAALVFVEFPEKLAIDVMHRMLTMGKIQQDVVNEVENTLKVEFKDSLAPVIVQDVYSHMADIFNAFNPSTEAKFMQELESKNNDAAQRIKDLILTLEDLKYIEEPGIKTILRIVDKEKLVIALKGASDSLKEVFFRNMSERAAKLLNDEIMSLGMVKIRTIYEAQQEIVGQARELIKKDEIHLIKLLFNKRV